MDHQISPESKEYARKLVYAAESCQVQAQQLVAQCSGGAGEDCADNVGRFFAAAEHCIDACEAMIAQCSEEVLSCSDAHSKDTLEKCIEALKACVRVCYRSLEQCKMNAKACVEATVAVVQACDHAAQATQACVS